jgi:hypothetical protein
MRRLVIAVLSMALLAFSAGSTVGASAATGALRITPHGSYYPEPIMLTSPATFNITAIDHLRAYDPNILLVMTDASYQGLKSDVMVEWEGGSINFTKAQFTSVELDNAYVPPTGTTNGVRYRVSSLKEHIGVNGTADDTLWYVYGPFLSKPISHTPQSFTITLNSENPRMLVYAIAKIFGYGLFNIACCNPFDTRVPPTQPGFVVPDAAPMLLALASFSAFGIYAVKRKKN